MKKLFLIAFSILAVQSSFAYDLKIDVLRVTKGEEIDEVRVNEGINRSVNRNALDIIVNCSTTFEAYEIRPANTGYGEEQIFDFGEPNGCWSIQKTLRKLGKSNTRGCLVIKGYNVEVTASACK